MSTTQRSTLPLNSIDVEGRVREDYGDLPSLMASIKKYGLIQPIVVTPANKLIAGGRRYFSHLALVEMGETQYSQIDVTFKEALDDDDLVEMELEENLIREDLTWTEYCLGILKIHRIKTRKSAALGESWTNAQTGIAINKSRQRVDQILPVARALEADRNRTTTLWLCNDTKEAQMWLISQAEELAKQELATRSLGKAGLALAQKFAIPGTPVVTNTLTGAAAQPVLIPSMSMPPGSINAPTQNLPGAPIEKPKLHINVADYFHHGHCIPWMITHKGEFHHIITDPPYAIDMDMIQQDNVGMDVSKTREAHEVEENLELLKDFVQAAFESMQDKGFLVMFCDAMNFRFLHDLGVKAGFAVQRWPVVWCKPQAANNSAGFNFTKATEDAIVMRKNNTTLINHQALNWRMIPKGPLDKDFDHPFAKPSALWDWFIDACTLPGQTILEPFAGSGSGVCPMIRKGRQWRACEREPQHVMEFLRNITKTYSEYLASNNATLEITYNPQNKSTEHDS